MTPIRLVHHAPGAPGLRWFGISPLYVQPEPAEIAATF